MNLFYPDIASLDAFTLSLDCLDEHIHCPHCHKRGQMLSHGFVYKQRSSVAKEPVGKRVLCSNRYGRSGCGRTLQLYVAHRFPFFQYGAAELFVFLSQLMLGRSVAAAYQAATSQPEPRQGWRWIKKLMLTLVDFRVYLNAPALKQANFLHRSRRLQLLLPTIITLFSKGQDNPCAGFQTAAQLCFI